MNCIFCDIVEGKISCKKIYENSNVLAFYDSEPKAPVHFLIIPKKHIESFMDIKADQFNIVGEIFSSIKLICEKLKLSSGFRVVNNFGTDGGQTVPHMHFHVLAKRKFTWPPG